MADIFGKRPEDYAHLQVLQKRAQWDDYQHYHAKQYPQAEPRHDFTAFGAGIPSEFHRAATDAQALGYLTNNLLAIQTQIDEILYTKFRLPSFIHLNMSIPDGAETYGIRIKDRVGQARRVTGPGWDAPTATVSRSLITHPVDYYGLDGQWSVDELRGAMFGGTPLDTETIDAAVEGSLEKMEQVGLFGNDEYKGLVNLPTTGDGAVNRADAAKQWTGTSAATAIEIRSTINGQLTKAINTSKEVLGTKITTGMSIYLPGSEYDLMTDLYLGDNQERTLMRAMKEDNSWSHFTENETGTREPLNFKRVLELNNAGDSDTQRMVTMLKNERIAEMGVPIMPRVLSLVNKGRVICAQVESKYSPLFVKRPTTIFYLDNIGATRTE